MFFYHASVEKERMEHRHVFSIVVPVYCVESYLNTCVRSILEQTYKDFELILVDDGSTDRSPQICDDYAAADTRVRVLHQPNRGASAARNAGIREAKGNYLLLVDADDFLPEREMLSELSYLINGKDLDVILYEIRGWEQRTDRYRIRYGPFDYSILNRFDHTLTLEYLFSQKRVPAGVYSLCVKRTLLMDCGIFFIEGVRSEDYDWIISVLLYSKRIYAIDRIYYVYREDQPRSVTSCIDLQHLRDLLGVAAKWSTAPGVVEPKLRKGVCNFAAYLYTTGLVVAGGFSKDDRKKGVALLREYRTVMRGARWPSLRLIRAATRVVGIGPTAVFLQKLYNYKLQKEYK